MKKRTYAFMSCVCILLFVPVFVCMASDDVAEISKIAINEERLEQSEEIKRYETVKGDTSRYLKFPEVRRGDLLYQGDIVETFEHVAARIEFSAVRYLLLGTGTEDDIDCRVLSVGKSCTMARFEGFQDGYPFWYIKKGFVAVSNMLAADARAEVVELAGTVYYFLSKKDETVIIVEEGAVTVKPRELGQATVVPEGYQITVKSPTTLPDPPVRVDRRILDEIHRWMRHGLVVIDEPGTGSETEEPTIRLSGRISGRISNVDVLVNGRKTQQLRVRNSLVTGDIALIDGENTIKIQASGDYGFSSDSITVVKKSPQVVQVAVPDILGKSENDAKKILERAQLSGGQVRYEATGGGNVGKVVEQHPIAGTRVALDGRIDFVVEQGIEVPNVIGLKEGDARFRLSQQRFGLQFEREDTGRGTVGTVVRQDPKAGKSVQLGSSVTITIETKKNATVPDLFGMDKDAAIFALAFNHLDNGKTSYQRTGKGEPDTVVQQHPAAGSSVRYRTPVDIVIEQGVSVPNVVGLSEKKALDRLGQQGLVGHVSRQTTGQGQVGTVVRQNPPAESSVRMNSAVALVVEKGKLILQPVDPVTIITPDVLAVGCPDPTVQEIRFELVSKTNDFQGRVRIVGMVKNIGNAAFESLKGQEQLVVSLYREWDPKPLVQRAFEKLEAGKSVNVVYEQDWSTTKEFPPTYELNISYTGNPKSGDCQFGNNTKQREGLEINALF